METNATGQNLAQAVEDGFHRRLLDKRGGHIEQGSIPTMGGRHAYIIFRHVHQTSTEWLNGKPVANASALDVPRQTTLCLAITADLCAVGSRVRSGVVSTREHFL